MEKTKNGEMVTKALMMGTALISINAMAISKARAATGTGPISAVILTPITVSGTVALDFGDMTQTAAGTMVMDTADTRTPGGGVVGIATNAGNSGIISLSAATGVAIDLSVTATSFTVSDGLANTMTVNAFNIRTNGGGTAETVTLAGATETFPIGGTLNVGPAQTAGTYTGTYTLDASYQ